MSMRILCMSWTSWRDTRSCTLERRRRSSWRIDRSLEPGSTSRGSGTRNCWRRLPYPWQSMDRPEIMDVAMWTGKSARRTRICSV
ncbi:hypothetical protein PENTCL1PPCAC_25916, partial [Pristionchus entomophagus]